MYVVAAGINRAERVYLDGDAYTRFILSLNFSVAKLVVTEEKFQKIRVIV